MNYYLNSASGFSFGSFFEAVTLELIVISIMIFCIRQLVKSIQFSKLIKMILNENYTLYQFTKTAQDKEAKERLILSTINEIRRLQPKMSYLFLNHRVAFEIHTLTQNIALRILLFFVKLLRYVAIVMLVGLILIFITIIVDNLQNMNSAINAIEMISHN